MNLLPAFEAGGTLLDGAALDAAAARTGAVGLLMTAAPLVFDPPTPGVFGGWQVDLEGVPAGSALATGGWIRRDSGTGAVFLSYEEPPGSDNWTVAAELADSPLGEWARLEGVITPASTTLRWKLNAAGDGQWSADDFVLDDGLPEDGGMAIWLTERAVKAVLKVLQDKLATELTAITTEANDGVALPAPDWWFATERAESIADAVQVEVWESGDVEFLNPERFIAAPGSAATRLANAKVPLRIRLTHGNRSGQTVPQIRDASRRYLAALSRVVLQYGCDATYLATYGVSTVFYRAGAIERPDDMASGAGGRVVLDCEVRLIETLSGAGEARPDGVWPAPETRG